MLNATNANQSTASQSQQQPQQAQAQPFQQPQPTQAQQAQAALARSRMAPAVLREAGSALVFAAGPLVPTASFGARIGSFSYESPCQSHTITGRRCKNYYL